MRQWRISLVVMSAALAMLLMACGSESVETSTSASTQRGAGDSSPTESSAASPTSAPASESEPSSTEPAQPSTTATTAPQLTSTSDRPETSAPTTTGPDIPSSGPAPWGADAIDPAALPDVYRLEWAEAGQPDTCPFLAFADLGPGAADATIRRGEHDREMLVTWDNPDGPGHDRTGEPCDDCGRGVVGLGTFQDGHVGQATIAWDDGSFANVAELPWVYGVSARIKPAGAECIYQLWSHLGHDHVSYLIGQLRLVEA